MAILVVDNDPSVRGVVCAMLKRHGYGTVAVPDPGGALSLTSLKPVELLLAELALPRMTGPELALEFLKTAPGTPVMFMSGSPQVDLPPGVPFLKKPFTLQALISRVEAVLARRAELCANLRAELERCARLIRESRALVAGTAAVSRESAEILAEIQEWRHGRGAAG
ncbi:MAG: response regulator [Bryobacterales bacterium]|nr:response regulator [Bryobacterales bacterium]